MADIDQNQRIVDVVASINSLVSGIREKLRVDNPARLIAFTLQMEDAANVVSVDNMIVSRPSISIVHTGEYLQSLLVLQDTCEVKHFDSETLSEIAADLLSDLETLSTSLHEYLLLWALEQKRLNPEFDAFALEAQLLQRVQGNRYSCFESRYNNALLAIHSDELVKLFDITAEELISGFDELRNQLTYGKADDANKLVEMYDATRLDKNASIENPTPEEIGGFNNLFERVFLEKRYEVASTIWPERLIKALSWSVGETCGANGDQSCWPLFSRQVHVKPFVAIGGKFYCFDYYAFVDNFYRAIRRVVLDADPNYTEKWQQRQNKASETAVANTMKRILPGCTCHTNNFYGTKKRRHENDILIEYKDALIVVEVKAGDFTLAPPLLDLNAHISRYKGLIEDGCSQCLNLLEFIKESDELPLFDNGGFKKACIDLRKIAATFALDVTVENLNAFAARAEKLAFLEVGNGIISLAFDDLLVYGDYFDSPLVFLHYLKHRAAATFNERLALKDELDHLGLYISDNCYELITEDYPAGMQLDFNGFRSELDAYYETIDTPLRGVPKPSQELPPMMIDILECLKRQGRGESVLGSFFLLDLADRKQLCEQIRQTHAEQCLKRRQLTCIFTGDDSQVELICFVNQPGLSAVFSENEKIERAATEILGTGRESMGLLVLDLDAYGVVTDALYELVSLDAIPSNRIEALREERFRVLSLRGIKPGRNDPCPCGSGKKFKRCHGR